MKPNINAQRVTTVFALTLVVGLYSSGAMAADLPWDSWICNVVNSLRSKVAIGLAAVALVWSAIAMATGEERITKLVAALGIGVSLAILAVPMLKAIPGASDVFNLAGCY